MVTSETNGDVLSAVRVFHRQLWLPGGRVPVGGIGEVSTRGEARGQGLAGCLLRNALGYMDQNGQALALLHTSRADLAAYYARYNFVSVPMHRCVLPLLTKQPACCLPTTAADVVVRVTPDRLGELAPLHDEWAAREASGCSWRSTAYWSQWLQPLVDQDPTLSVWRTPTAYLIVRAATSGPAIFVGSLQVYEFVGAVDASRKLAALLTAALDYHGGIDRLVLPEQYASLVDNLSCIACATPPPLASVPAAWASAAEGTTLRIQVAAKGYAITDYGWMVRVANRSAAAAALHLPRLVSDESLTDREGAELACEWLAMLPFSFLALDSF